mgnify:CR=1 FL=1
MDSITQAVLGAAIGQSKCGPKIHNQKLDCNFFCKRNVLTKASII